MFFLQEINLPSPTWFTHMFDGQEPQFLAANPYPTQVSQLVSPGDRWLSLRPRQ